MDLETFVAQRRSAWNALDTTVRGGMKRIRADQFLELHRGVAADLAFARQHFGGTPLVEELTDLYTASHSVLYAPRGLRFGDLRSGLDRYAGMLRRCAASAGVAGAVLLAAALAGWLWARADLTAATAVLPTTLNRHLLSGEPTALVPLAGALAAVAGAWFGGAGALPGLCWVGTSLGVAVAQADAVAGLRFQDAALVGAVLAAAGTALATGASARAGLAWWRGVLEDGDVRAAGLATLGGAVAIATGLALSAAEVSLVTSAAIAAVAVVLVFGPVAIPHARPRDLTPR